MLEYWIWFSQLGKLSDRSKRLLMQHYHDPEEIYYAEADAIGQIDGMTEDQISALQDKDLNNARAIEDECAKKGLKIVTFEDAAYPQRLKYIADPPMILYYKGKLPDWNDRPAIGVVGTRKASAYGLTTARKMGYQIARCGGIVVSGMARGIDSMAMDGALLADSPTVGVLGCGADRIYPLSNRKLFEDVERYGCILSEFAPGTEPLRWNFPKRNRIISGLSNGVLVVEAPEKSGALITASQALDQGRDVFAIPGNVDQEGCAGSNKLLRSGAIFASCGWDVVSEYEALYPGQLHEDTTPMPGKAPETPLQNPGEEACKVAQKPKHPRKKPDVPEKLDEKAIDKDTSGAYSDVNTVISRLIGEEQSVAKALKSGECLVDDVIVETGLPARRVMAILTMLEIKGIVRRLPGKRVALK